MEFLPHPERIEAFCHKWKVREFSVFGSVARGMAGPDSDVDVLVDFDETAEWSLFDLAEMRDELSYVWDGREVDLVTRSSIERSRNPIRKKSILDSLEVIHGS